MVVLPLRLHVPLRSSPPVPLLLAPVALITNSPLGWFALNGHSLLSAGAVCAARVPTTLNRPFFSGTLLFFFREFLHRAAM